MLTPPLTAGHILARLWDLGLDPCKDGIREAHVLLRRYPWLQTVDDALDHRHDSGPRFERSVNFDWLVAQMCQYIGFDFMESLLTGMHPVCRLLDIPYTDDLSQLDMLGDKNPTAYWHFQDISLDIRTMRTGYVILAMLPGAHWQARTAEEQEAIMPYARRVLDEVYAQLTCREPVAYGELMAWLYPNGQENDDD